jgi:hypothetical protein
MAKGSTLSRPPASRSVEKNGAFSPSPARLAPNLPPSIRRHYTCKEFSAALFELAEINLGERAIARRCSLPFGDPARIATNPAFPGRHYIPASELARLAGTEGVS